MRLQSADEGRMPERTCLRYDVLRRRKTMRSPDVRPSINQYRGSEYSPCSFGAAKKWTPYENQDRP